MLSAVDPAQTSDGGDSRVGVTQAGESEARSIGKGRAESQDGLSGFVGSTVTSAGAAAFGRLGPGNLRPDCEALSALVGDFYLRGLGRGCASLAPALILVGNPNDEAAAALTPSPAYFKTSRRVVTLAPDVCESVARPAIQAILLGDRILQKRYSQSQNYTEGGLQSPRIRNNMARSWWG